MTILLVGYMMGLGRKLKILFWYYLAMCCLLGVLFVGTTSAYNFQNYCGDGEKASTEECDDGNNSNGDGCDYNCYLESSSSGATTTTGTDTNKTTSYSTRNIYKPTGEDSTSTLPDIAHLLESVIDHSEQLQDLGEDNNNFGGSNIELYKILHKTIQGQLPSTQRTIIRRIMNGINTLNKQLLETRFNLDRDGIVDFLSKILDVQLGRNTFSLDALLDPNGISRATDIQYITPGSTQPTQGKYVVYYLEDQTDVVHLDRNFGNGETYGCEIYQCSRIPIIYDNPGRYEVRLTKRYRNDHVEVLYKTVEVQPQDLVSDEQIQGDKLSPTTNNGIYKATGTARYVGTPIQLLDNNLLSLKIFPINSDIAVAQQYTVFSLTSRQSIKHIDRSFGDGQTHGCEWNACTMVPIIYQQPGTYQLLVTITHANGEISRLTNSVIIQ